LNRFFLQFKRELTTQRQQAQARSQRESLRRRGKEIQGFRTVQEGEEAITSLFPDFKENQHKTERNSRISEESNQIPDKAR